MVKEGVKNFSDLPSAWKKSSKEAEEKEIGDLFERVLKGHIKDVPRGNFPSRLSGIGSMTFIPLLKENGATEDCVNAVIFYTNKNGKEARFTWTISERGMQYGVMPSSIDITREVIAKEILQIIERVNLSFWKKTNLDILPNHDEGEPREKTVRGEGGGKDLTDPERLEFMQSQPRAISGFLNKIKGFTGYRGIIFPNFIILENDKKDNAAFIFDLPRKIEIEAERFRLPSSQRINDAEQKNILAEFWKPISEQAKTRKELQALGAKRIIHTPGKWKEKMQQEINSRLEKR
ncbi:MAG: hypothetical protein UX07_C0002G0004 [Parcubacteria group bacterium GW2011_GWA2_45_30]|nr:MAG: hypothetical protein UX07_C0002G0004 [Parcubacteria group bacterium GW2011_GWA2_45_30]